MLTGEKRQRMVDHFEGGNNPKVRGGYVNDGRKNETLRLKRMEAKKILKIQKKKPILLKKNDLYIIYNIGRQEK